MNEANIVNYKGELWVCHNWKYSRDGEIRSPVTVDMQVPEYESLCFGLMQDRSLIIKIYS